MSEVQVACIRIFSAKAILDEVYKKFIEDLENYPNSLSKILDGEAKNEGSINIGQIRFYYRKHDAYTDFLDFEIHNLTQKQWKKLGSYLLKEAIKHRHINIVVEIKDIHSRYNFFYDWITKPFMINFQEDKYTEYRKNYEKLILTLFE